MVGQLEFQLVERSVDWKECRMVGMWVVMMVEMMAQRSVDQKGGMMVVKMENWMVERLEEE